MPDRVLREKILTSDMVNALNWPAEVFYRRLMSKADDYGRIYADPDLLRADLYAKKIDKVSRPDVVKWLTECVTAGLVRQYTVEQKAYLEILQFNQRLRAMRSKYPEPPENEENKGAHADDSRVLTGDSRVPPESESESERNAKAFSPGSSPPVVDKKEIFGRILKTKKVLYQFIAEYRPDFIEPYVELWNLFAGERKKSQISKVSDSRRRKFNTRIREKSFDFLAILVKAGGAGDFLSTSKWFTWDWIMDSEANYLKVIEGNYDKGDKPKAPPAEKPEKPKVLEKTKEELNYLFGMFCEGNLTVISLYPEHYDYLKQNCGIFFTDLQVEEIKQKAEGYCKEKEVVWNEANQKKYMKLYGVMEFFNHRHETNGTGAIFTL